VTGTQGQVSKSLLERGLTAGVEIQCLGRPQLDLADPIQIQEVLGSARADVIVNAAAYTAVDRAESEEILATRINGAGAGHVAAAAYSIGAPIIHLSTDYVFDGALDRPYCEEDATGPISAYGRSKLQGEREVIAANPNHVILRTSWVYSPFGNNFVKTMLRLGETRPEVSVVADQRGNPTSALEIADAVITVALKLVSSDSRAVPCGIFHLSGTGETTWAGFAAAIFAQAVRNGRAPVSVKHISTADYPTPARRPANSRLNTSRFRETFGVQPPSWRESTCVCVDRLLASSGN
jgi:dTDP-4-dehydrorhamnose reductase